jgi:hypothetical protein
MSGSGGSRASRGDGGAARTSVNRDFNNAPINRPSTSSTTARDLNAANRPATGVGSGANRAAGGVSSGDRAGGGDVTRDRNTNRNVNRNVNRDVNGNFDLDYDYDNNWHPVARAAAWTAGAAITAAAIGSVVYSLPPSCTVTMVNSYSYHQCGSVWYQPQYVGTSVEYIVVEQPQ